MVRHPHDILMAKRRMEVKDREHVTAILAEFPLPEAATLAALVEEMPHRRGLVAADRAIRFEAGLQELRALRSRGS